MRGIAGAILLIGTLALGPTRATSGWGALTGFCIGMGILMVTASFWGDDR
jgi:hypothetical protein